MICPDRSFAYQQQLALHNADVKRTLLGFNVSWDPKPVFLVRLTFFYICSNLHNIAVSPTISSPTSPYIPRGIARTNFFYIWILIYLDPVIQQVAIGQW